MQKGIIHAGGVRVGGRAPELQNIITHAGGTTPAEVRLPSVKTGLVPAQRYKRINW